MCVWQAGGGLLMFALTPECLQARLRMRLFGVAKKSPQLPSCQSEFKNRFPGASLLQQTGPSRHVCSEFSSARKATAKSWLNRGQQQEGM